MDNFAWIQNSASDPKMTFLMPVYNQQGYVRAAIQSVLSQTGVVIEVIISDDASSDSTFKIARQTVIDWCRQNTCPHRIVLRKGPTRLRRDHIALMTEAASCDLVCQAHGDDTQHPSRAQMTVQAFEQMPALAMLAVDFNTIDQLGHPVGDVKPIPPVAVVTPFPMETILEGHNALIGFNQAWRRSVMRHFARLDSNLAAIGHDRIMPFRAGLVGEVLLLNVPLVTRRVHNGAWTSMLYLEKGVTRGQFGWSMSALSALAVMKADLERARAQKLITGSRYTGIAGHIDGITQAHNEALLEAFRQQTQAGMQIAWVDDKTLQTLRT